MRPSTAPPKRELGPSTQSNDSFRIVFSDAECQLLAREPALGEPSSGARFAGVPLEHSLFNLRAAAPDAAALLAVQQWVDLIEHVSAPPWPLVTDFVVRLCVFYEQGVETLHNTLELLKFAAIDALQRALAPDALPGEGASVAAAAAAAGDVRLAIPETDILAALLISSKVRASMLTFLDLEPFDSFIHIVSTLKERVFTFFLVFCIFSL